MKLRELMKGDLEVFISERVRLMQTTIDRSLKRLAEYDMNINALIDQDQYRAALHNQRHPLHERAVMRELIWKISGRGVCCADNKLVVTIDELKIQEILRQQERSAQMECAKFLEKLEQKVRENLGKNEIQSATVRGDLWKESHLEVFTSAGQCLLFVTKAKINFSKFGDAYIQFPTLIYRTEPAETSP